MFLYFIQEKGFLNGDKDYLRNKLAESRDRKPDAYYRDFRLPALLPGLCAEEGGAFRRHEQVARRDPYLNGGLFQKHQIEELHGKTIVMPTLPLRNSLASSRNTTGILTSVTTATATRSIRTCSATSSRVHQPEQMGAYYTKEDITEHIAQNTIIPFLLAKPQGLCRGLCAEQLGLASAPG